MAASYNENDCLMLDLLTDDLLADVFSFLGPIGTTQCSKSCTTLQQVSYCSRTLWGNFVRRYFGLQVADSDSSTNTIDWRAVYAYLALSGGNAPRLLDGSVVFSDDGSCIPGYAPENALRLGPEAWCTNVGVDKNIDLVLKLQGPTLVSGFAARNGDNFYSAPLNEALVFCSPNPIDLDASRQFDGENGSKWVTRYHDAGQHDQQTNVPHSQNTATTVTDHDSSVDVLNPVATNPSYSFQSPLEPKVAFQFPKIPQAYSARQERRCPPTVAQYIHFKLLSSHKCPRRQADNIDVVDLHSFGVPLPELPALLQGTIESSVPDPSYKRQHKLREFPRGLLHLFPL